MAKKDDKKAVAVPGAPKKKGRLRLNPKVQRKKDEGEELKLKRSAEKQKEITVIGISVTLFIIFLVLGIAGFEKIEKDIEGKTISREPLITDTKLHLWDTEVVEEAEDEDEEDIVTIEPKYIRAPNWIILGLICLFLPLGMWYGKKAKRIINVEARLSDFLRDLAESAKAGVTLAETIRIAADGDYGDLTPEIRKMSYQISWGVNATDALEMFAERTNTPLVHRAVTLIVEATNAGGDIAKVLEAAASDTKEIQLLQKEREIQMFMYVAVIFVAFVVFLVVILIVYRTFVPQMEALAKEQIAQAEASGEQAQGPAGGLDPTKTDFQEIKDLYLYAGLVQGIGDGLIAGIMGTGRFSDGAKYSAVMLLIVFVIFTFVF